ncbi:MAG TPA: helix-turn-helix domain-containing protein, partial [Spirochaetia bacterium]|nr:helix-turn-helix domain-containing protein [Spirochaetia bacterium]
SFPGNIRELEGMIFDAVVRHQSWVLSLDSFRAAIGERSGSPAESPQGACGDEGENPFATCQSLPTLREANRFLIEESLRRADGNQATAARLLGLSRTALNRRLNRNP